MTDFERQTRAVVFHDGQETTLAGDWKPGDLADVVVDIGDGLFTYTARVDDDLALVALTLAELDALPADRPAPTRAQLDDLADRWGVPRLP